MKTALGLVTVAVSFVIAAGSVHAGGFTRGGADIDIIYDDGTFETRDGATFVDPNRKYNKKPGVTGVTTQSLDGKEFSDSYWVPSLAAKYSFNDNLACVATYTVSNGAESDNGGINDRRGKIKEGFTTDEYALTCRVSTELGKGRISLLGGLFYEDFSYDLDAVTFVAPGVLSPLKVDLHDHDWGWRAGVAYEIPEYAFRTSLMYRSGTSAEATGDARLTNLGVDMGAQGFGELPQSLELKVQSGIAPDWLAFGSVKWTDWSVMDRLHLKFGPQDFYNDYYWRDGWTVSAGVGHKFNEHVSGFASLIWDRGVSTGWDLYGDTQAIAVGATVTDKIGGELRLTAAAVHLDSVSETNYGALNADTQSTWGYALQANYKLKF
jgi:long-chain fatty acid transport protein